jgi:hypothetical protein
VKLATSTAAATTVTDMDKINGNTGLVSIRKDAKQSTSLN